jgi:tetratricopeptide (TPR) repeat protein
MTSKPVHLLLLASGVAAVTVWFWWTAQHNPHNSLLPTDSRGTWMVYPTPPDTEMHPAAALTTEFRAELHLTSTDASTRLWWRAYRAANLTVNGRTITNSTTDHDWKQPRCCDLTDELRAGTNSIWITVTNDYGPPALWVWLENRPESTAKGLQWQASYAGAVWQTAADASTPRAIRAGNKLFGGETAVSALPRAVSFLVAGAIMLGVALGLANQWRTLGKLPFWDSPRGRWLQEWWPLLVVGGYWLAMLTNNLPQLPSLFGFDTDGHTEYIRYVQQHGRLPLANEGWQMYQPPLYYILSSALLGLLGQTMDTPGAITLIRAMSGMIGFTNVLLVYLSLRRLFPKERGLQLGGLLFAGFLPAQLYLSHYITNEGLVATLATATFYFAIRTMQTQPATKWLYAATGGCLGLALLAKFSAVLLIPFVGVLLLPAAMRERGWRKLSTWRGPALAILTAGLVCGWHYGRVWAQFGTPLVGNWSPEAGFRWWQDNGYTTAKYFLSFGKALTAPLYSGFGSFWDGAYSTLWADGLCSGGARIGFRPPWNYDLMLTGGWMALLPMGLIITGAIRLGVRRGRTGDTVPVVWPAVLVTFLLAIAAMTLRVPSYAQAKSVYGLSVLLPLSLCLVEGLKFVGDNSTWRRRVVMAGLVLWAWLAVGSFWISSGAVATQLIAATNANELSQAEIALAAADSALARDPHNAAAAGERARALQALGRVNEAWEQIQTAIARHSGDANLIVQQAQLLAVTGNNKDAAALAAKAAALAPDHPQAWHNAAVWNLQVGQTDEAIRQAREALRIRPGEGVLHLVLGNALATRGEVAEGLKHLRLAVELKPDWALGMNELAWRLASAPRAEWRNGAEAVTWAEKACALSENQTPKFVGTLAAAYAEAGRFNEAVTTAGRAIEVARASGQMELVQRNEQLLGLYRNGQAYHDPEQR